MNSTTFFALFGNLKTTLAGPLGGLGVYLLSVDPTSKWGHLALAVALIFGFSMAADARKPPPQVPPAV